jgi:hypothetical protein
MGWLKNALSENEMLNSILRRKRQRVLRSTLKLINDPPLHVPYVFNNMIRSDGHTIEFIYGVRHSSSGGLPDLTMSDISDLSDLPTDLQKDLDEFDIFEVDPGHRHLVTGVNAQGVRRRFSNNEWYCKSGILQRRYDQQERRKDTGIDQVESRLSTKKTASCDLWISYCQAVFDNMPQFAAFYGTDFANDRFLNYVGRQKMEDEVTNIFVDGDRKYRGEENIQT